MGHPEHDPEGGTEKAEDAKPPDAGISRKQGPGKRATGEEPSTGLSENRREEHEQVSDKSEETVKRRAGFERAFRPG
jgi:hypothetical protein